MQYICRILSPIGPLTAASDGDQIIGLWMEEQKYYANTLESNAKEAHLPVFSLLQTWLDGYFRGDHTAMTLPLAPKGSPFRQAVWDVLRQIPAGKLATYGDIAKRLAAQMGIDRMSAQAVGNAVGHNPISILIPCHRVVGAKGSLTGYAGGIAKKMFLLRLEGIDIDTLYVPSKGTAL